MKFCPHCGKPIQFEQAEICPACGCRVSGLSFRSGWITIVVLIAILAVLCIIAAGIFQLLPVIAGKTTPDPAMPAVTVSPDSSLTVTWKTMADWSGWEHNASWSGKSVGTSSEYTPRIVNGHGEYGAVTALLAGSMESSVQRTFTDPSGNGWNTLTFVGNLAPSDIPQGRWMKIEVNGNTVFSADATQVPPGNGAIFSIPVHFPRSNIVKVKISNGQKPCWGGNPWTMEYYSLRLSLEKDTGT
jgi:hypothetical protein